MTIWSSEIRELDKLTGSIKGSHPKLEKELSRLLTSGDENMVLVYSRRCLEIIISELCEYELNRSRGTEPLRRIIDKLNREEKVPSHIIGSMNNINSISTFGAHPKEFEPEQVKPVLLDLATCLRWYVHYSENRGITGAETMKQDAAGNHQARAGKAHMGRERTQSFQKEVKAGSGKGKAGSGKRIAGVLAVVISIIGALVIISLKYLSPEANGETVAKSIAVLPFKSLSNDPEKQYQADGVMDAILLHLSKIEDLRVMSRTSVEQYRNTEKTVEEICDELDVVYLLEGSFQKYGDHARLIVQLIRPDSEKHIWAENYDREWKDIFSVQSEVAEHIAGELRAVLTPDEV